MHWDGTVTLGNAISIVVTLGGIFMAYSAIRERLMRIETQLEPLWREFERRRAGR